MAKVAYNACYGGFTLSGEARERYAILKGHDYPDDWRVERDDPVLIQVIEELGKAANGPCSELQVAEVPAGTLYRIDAYDGLESVDTVDSYEWKVARD